ncbi:MAG: hypothetical protein WBK43_03845 [Prolixibacteraceae bacterium]|nr:hypothetical protein [Prolixibacteraceae bacterium]MDI9565004.1 hypothetical protein [Bacteroidota bacterium]NLT00311.1 hypothetical protein [Bacteroidales bacterium]HNZ69198.1 hypothetical protein [Prolixibacteraceae bacterium]HOC86958.1 hypothetical protein [Prolixibacteraceae bacterium]
MLFLIIVSGCCAMKQGKSDPFRIADAFYYAWFVDETERGTRIELTIDRVREEICFESLVFRNRRIPVTAYVGPGFVRLEAFLNFPGSVLQDRSEPAEGEDRLYFLRNGQESSMAIDSFRREETKYIKRE